MNKTLIFSALCGAIITSVNAEESKSFTMDGEFGLIVTTGNTETTSVKGKITAHHELDRWSNDFILDALYKKDEVTIDEVLTEQTTAQKVFASGQGNYKLENPDHRLFVFGSYEDDRFSSYDYQSTLAVGWNQKLWRDETSSFEYSVGPGYSYNKTNPVVEANGTVTPGESENGLIVRGALDYQWKISDTATFKQSLSSEVGSNNTKSKSVSSLSAKLLGSLSMKFSVTMDHNTDVAANRDKLDTQTAVTLVYSFF